MLQIVFLHWTRKPVSLYYSKRGVRRRIAGTFRTSGKSILFQLIPHLTVYWYLRRQLPFEALV